MLNKIFVYDIETIPDTDVLYNLTGSKTVDVIEKRKELEEYSSLISNGNPFPRQLFHKVISVSILIADIKNIDGYEYYNIEKIGTISSINSKEINALKRKFISRKKFFLSYPEKRIFRNRDKYWSQAVGSPYLSKPDPGLCLFAAGCRVLRQ